MGKRYLTLLACLCMLVQALTLRAESYTWDVTTQTSWDYTLQSQYKDKTLDITFKNKTFEGGGYHVVALPFQVSKAVLDETFGSGAYEVQTYYSYSATKGYVFKKATGSFVIAMGRPFLLKVDHTVSDPTFKNVVLTGVDANAEQKITCNDTHFIGTAIFSKNPCSIQWDHKAAMNWRLNTVGLLEMIPYEDGTMALSAYFGNTAYVTSTDMQLSIEGYEPDPTKMDLTNSTQLAYAISKQVQLTNLPTIYINCPDIASASEIDTKLYKQGDTAPYLNATITVKDASGSIEAEETDAQYLQIKVRGNSTSSPKKRPYRLKFAKKHKHDLLGRGYTKRNWTLLANVYDDTKVRNAITYHLNQAVGMDFCPGYKFVDLVINGDYRGCYQVSDHCEVDGNRIDVDDKTGWYLESTPQNMAEDPKVVAGGLTVSIKNPEGKTTAQTDSIKTLVTDYMNTLRWAFKDYTDSGWRAMVDEESLVNFYTAINLTGDYDGFMVVKMYREADGKMHYGPVWDKDLAYGNTPLENQQALAEKQQGGGNWAGVAVNYGGVWGDAGFISKVYDKIKQLSDGGLSTMLCQKADSLSELISESMVLDSIRWDGNSLNANSGWTTSYKNRQLALDALKTYIPSHIDMVLATVKTQFDALGCTSGIQQAATATERKSGLVYDLWGHCVGRTTDPLPRGIYIIDGKKVAR